jgi:membrane-associated phospholipid phosphatase
MNKELFRKFEAFDVITVAYSVVSGIILLFASFKLDDIQTHLLVRMAFIAFIVFAGLVLNDKENQFLKVLRNFYFLPIILYFVSEGNYQDNILFPDLDKYMANFEMTIFSGHPGVFLSNMLHYKWLSEFMCLTYLSYYVLILAFLIKIYRKHDLAFGQTAFLVCFTFYMLFIIYVLCPVAGPQYALVPPDNQIPEGFFIRDMAHWVITKFDLPASAFPSSNALILCFIVLLVYRNFRAKFKFYLPLAILIIFSTIYLKLHYTIDVIAGLLAFPAFYWIGTRTYDLITYFLNGNVKSWSDFFYSLPKAYGKH